MELQANTAVLFYRKIRIIIANNLEAETPELAAVKKWPCYFFNADTSGEKPFEEFYASDDVVDWHRFTDIGIVKWQDQDESAVARAQAFLSDYHALRQRNNWQRAEVVEMLKRSCPTLSYVDTGKFLSGRM